MNQPTYVAESQGRAAVGLPDPIGTPEQAVTLLSELAEFDRESFMVLALNARHAPIAPAETVSVGSVNASIVHPREVFRCAIQRGAVALLVAHNHPNGDPEPSAEDIAITKRLVDAGELLGIGLLDHIITARGGAWLSMRARRMGGL